MARRVSRLLQERPDVAGVVVYLAATLVYLLVASPALLRAHTPFNHFALLAESWLGGRLDLGRSPPWYAAGNDFALYAGRWFIVFPGVPALLVLPWVALAGTAERTLDGLFFLLLAGVAPAGIYLLLDRLRREGLATVGRGTIVAITALYAFGTVYFFTAVQGTVWFAAHVVAAGATSFFLYAAIGARSPVGAGIALAIAAGTRPVLGALGLFFLLEWCRVRQARSMVRGHARNPHVAREMLPLVWFGLPVAVTVAVLAWHNWMRFGSPTEFGYRYLAVAWQARIEKWGLFSYHYLARNLGILLTSLPYLVRDAAGWSFQVNGHGLALWVTTPLYLWLLWPRATTSVHRSAYVALGAVALPSLFYQNSGWIQFGQRFSNDYAPLLVLLLGIGAYTWSRAMKAAWCIAVVVNAFGAITFGRPEYSKYYFIERTQRIIYQPD